MVFNPQAFYKDRRKKKGKVLIPRVLCCYKAEETNGKRWKSVSFCLRRWVRQSVSFAMRKGEDKASVDKWAEILYNKMITFLQKRRDHDGYGASLHGMYAGQG